MVQTDEGDFLLRDDVKLYTKTWKPDQPSSIHLIFVHGFSDHINAYYNLFPTLASPPYNITVHGFDQRGWGRSASKKSEWGMTGDTQQVLTDIYDFICDVSSSITAESTFSKLFLMGHSMGGAESLVYLLSDESTFTRVLKRAQKPLPITGLLVESPHIAFPHDSQPNAFTVFAGRLASRLLPNMQLVQKLDPSFMSRDPKVCQEWANDPLCHDTGTLKGLAGLLDRADYLNTFDAEGHNYEKRHLGMRGTLPCPVWVAHGNADKVCDYEASKKLYEKLATNSSDDVSTKGSVFKTYEGGYHKLHAEPDGMSKQFAIDAGDWILRIAGNVKEASAPVEIEAQPNTGTQSHPDAERDSMKARL